MTDAGTPPVPPPPPPYAMPPQGQNPGNPYPGRTLGIVGLILAFVVSLAGVIVSAVALAQSRRAGLPNGFALAGIIVGAVLTVLSLFFTVLIVAAIVNAASEDAADPGPVTTATAEPSPDEETGEGTDAYALTVGDCFNDPNVDEILEVPVVDCAEPHDFEVFAEFDLDGDAFPGAETVAADADAGCLAEYEPFVGLAYDQSALDFTFYTPTKQSWASGDRLVSCLIYDPEAPNTGTLAGAAR